MKAQSQIGKGGGRRVSPFRASGRFCALLTKRFRAFRGAEFFEGRGGPSCCRNYIIFYQRKAQKPPRSSKMLLARASSWWEQVALDRFEGLGNKPRP